MLYWESGLSYLYFLFCEHNYLYELYFFFYLSNYPLPVPSLRLQPLEATLVFNHKASSLWPTP